MTKQALIIAATVTAKPGVMVLVMLGVNKIKSLAVAIKSPIIQLTPLL